MGFSPAKTSVAAIGQPFSQRAWRPTVLVPFTVNYATVLSLKLLVSETRIPSSNYAYLLTVLLWLKLLLLSVSNTTGFVLYNCVPANFTRGSH